MEMSHGNTTRKSLYKVGATTALMLVLVSWVDMVTGFTGEARAPGT